MYNAQTSQQTNWDLYDLYRVWAWWKLCATSSDTYTCTCRENPRYYKAHCTLQLYLVRTQNALVVRKIVRDVVNTDEIRWRMFNTTQCWNCFISKTKERANINWKHKCACASLINMALVLETQDVTKRFNAMTVMLKTTQYTIHA